VKCIGSRAAEVLVAARGAGMSLDLIDGGCYGIYLPVSFHKRCSVASHQFYTTAIRSGPACSSLFNHSTIHSYVILSLLKPERVSSQTNTNIIHSNHHPPTHLYFEPPFDLFNLPPKPWTLIKRITPPQSTP
jgi:hypothetical protein